MKTVLIGSNEFIDCATILSLAGTRAVIVDLEPLRVSLRTPPKIPSGRVVNVFENEVRSGTAPQVRVVAGEHSVTIFWERLPLLSATLLEPTTASVRIDLRPLGINVYDDVLRLHAGRMDSRENKFRDIGGAAIALG